MGIQAPVVNDLDHGSKTMLLELWCWCAGKRAIAEEEGTVVGFHAARIQGQHVERRSGGVRRGVWRGYLQLGGFAYRERSHSDWSLRSCQPLSRRCLGFPNVRYRERTCHAYRRSVGVADDHGCCFVMVLPINGALSWRRFLRRRARLLGCPSRVLRAHVNKMEQQLGGDGMGADMGELPKICKTGWARARSKDKHSTAYDQSGKTKTRAMLSFVVKGRQGPW